MPHKNHILFISSWYPNRNNPTHGIFNRAFAEAASRYIKVSVLHVCSDERLSTEFEQEELTEANITTVIVYYKKIKNSFPIISQLRKRKRLLEGFETGYRQLVAKTGTPDLIQLNVVMPAGIGAQHLSKKYGIPYIVNEGWSGYCPDDGSYKGLALKHLTEKIISSAKVIMPVSTDLQEAMLKHDLRGTYRIVPNVVDVNRFCPKKEVPHVHSRFIHISTLDDSQKNVSGILSAFKNALTKQPGMELTIVGEGTNRLALENLADKLGLGNAIKFTGRLMDQPLVDRINESDALVMFSNYETFCLTVAESLACGKPVITSKAGGLTNQIGSSFGMMIDKKDENALTECMLRFKTIRERFDPMEMRQFITDNYSTEKIGERLNAIYDSVLSKEKKV